MGRSRNLADLLDANGDVKSGSLDNVPPSNDASALTTGTLSADRLAAGSIGAAKLADTYLTPTGDGSSLTGIEKFDDNKLVNDVSTLALRMAVSENAVAYSTSSQFIDVFQDDSGVTNLTSTERNSSEYIGIAASTVITNISPEITGGGNQTPGQTAAGTSSYTGYDGVTRSNGQVGDSVGYTYASYAIGNIFAENEDFELILSVRGTYQGTGYLYGNEMSSLGSIGTFMGGGYIGSNYTDAWSSLSQGTYQGQYHSPTSGDGGYNYYNLYRWSRVSNNFKLQYYGRNTNPITIDATSIAAVRNSTNYVDNIGSPRTLSDKFVPLIGEAGGEFYFIRIEVANTSVTNYNTTGSFENNTITALSSVSSMGAIITYEDVSGTNALNTDIVLQLSADGGSNWSTATLVPLPDYSSSIKMAKVNDLAVTAGTSLKYKISFANQASGSKEARIRGVALQY